nr:PREDICTED: cold shock domain-containing protein 4-like [Musa acuminata subsp. malaccensis]
MVQASSRSRGTVKWFNDTKGFGFIWPDDGGEDLFVHRYPIKAQVYRTFAESDVAEGDDGPSKAVDITGPGGSDIQGGGGCRSDCYGRVGMLGLPGGDGNLSCYSCGVMGYFAREFPCKN